MSTNGMMKAVQRLVGKAATTVHNEGNEQLKQRQDSIPVQQQMYKTWSTTAAANANTYTFPVNYSGQTQGKVWGQASPAGLGALSQYANYQQPAPILTFTDDQMTTFMLKLADLLSRSWECLRCHRIWSPQENGCEFCNFIDRLEGKDVERDEAPKQAVIGK